MLDPITILALGFCVTFISIYNFRFINKWIKQYIPDLDDDKDASRESRQEKLSIKLLTNVPLEVLEKIKLITMISVPMLISGIYMIIYAAFAF